MQELSIEYLESIHRVKVPKKNPNRKYRLSEKNKCGILMK